MAARSFDIVLRNFTNTTLFYQDHSMAHGKMTIEPNADVKDMEKCHFRSESDGFMTGTEGKVLFGSDAGQFSISWDNPFSGSNSFYVQKPNQFGETHGEISGDNAAVTVCIYQDS